MLSQIYLLSKLIADFIKNQTKQFKQKIHEVSQDCFQASDKLIIMSITRRLSSKI
ncbi:hypothetical protein pb186bvf_010012 [Paramecium bursaria]